MLDDLFISLIKENKEMTKEQKKEKIKEIKAERKERSRSSVIREWKKYIKKSKKELIKLTKEFQPWDYSFILNPLYKMIEIFYNTFKHTELLAQDTRCDNYKETIESLEKCNNLIKDLDNSDSIEKDYELIEEILGTMKEKIFLWWD